MMWLLPATRNCLLPSYHNETDLPMGIRAILSAAFFAIVCFGSIPLRAENPVKEKQDRFNLAVECIKRFEGWHGNHLPYVGYGHKLLPGETFRPDMSEAQADSLLRADLRKLCRMCSRFGKDSLLVATLSYNVGYYRLVGYGKIPKSRLIQKLEAGDRDIYEDFIKYCHYRGKKIPSIERRRKEEYALLYIQ